MDFVAIDFETANADMASICQVGVALVENGAIQDEWKTLIDPEDSFDGMNVAIHGIDENAVKGAPILPKVIDHLYHFLDDRIAICHTPFDRVATQQACAKYALRLPACTWLDSARVARRTWREFAYSGYGVKNICDVLGYRFTHHDALEDAKAAAHIMMAAIEKSGFTISDWLARVELPIGVSTDGGSTGVAREGNPEGPLHGETIVFTGALKMPRWEAAEIAAKLGCAVADGVTKKTTILVVGDQDVKKLAGREKSSKHRKAEDLIRKGHAIRILMESDFKALCRAREKGNR